MPYSLACEGCFKAVIVLWCEAPSIDGGVRFSTQLAKAPKSGKDMLPLTAPASIMGAKQLALAVCTLMRAGRQARGYTGF